MNESSLEIKNTPELRFAILAPEVWSRLNEIPRTGWVNRGVKNPETVQEHTVALRNLFLGIAHELPEFSQEDIQDILDMLEVHDWHEAVDGDEVIVTDDQKEKVLALQNILILSDNENLYDAVFNSDHDEVYKIGFFAGYLERQDKKGDITLGRIEEITKFNEVLEKMVSDSSGALGTKEELFENFTKAHFTGNYLFLARKIEKVLGKGSFRRIATELGDMRTEEGLETLLDLPTPPQS